jgi:sensor domain CHASE-containing protein
VYEEKPTMRVRLNWNNSQAGYLAHRPVAKTPAMMMTKVAVLALVAGKAALTV